MSQSSPSGGSIDNLDREQMMSARFANMVLQQTNMALMFLGKVPHPETGETLKELEAARMFIDQLEMLEAKTKGNLTKQEEGLLKESLMALRLAFVDAAEKESAAPSNKRPASATPAAESKTEAAAAKPAETPSATKASPAEDESRKKFVKKY
jgi:hypothetical protein